MVTKRQLDTLAQHIDRLAPPKRPTAKLYMRFFGGKVVADEDGTPSLPVRRIVNLDGVPELFSNGKAYDENGKECRWCMYDETDEDMMKRYPELRGRDGKMVPMITIHFA